MYSQILLTRHIFQSPALSSDNDRPFGLVFGHRAHGTGPAACLRILCLPHLPRRPADIRPRLAGRLTGKSASRHNRELSRSEKYACREIWFKNEGYKLNLPEKSDNTNPAITPAILQAIGPTGVEA
jgi:hypothetical protein